MVYNSLTEAPHTFREGIDWLIALKGNDAEKNLAAMGAALHKFLADKPVGKMELPALEEVKRISKQFVAQPELKYMWPADDVLRRFNERIIKSHRQLRKIVCTIYDSDYLNVIKSKRLTAQKITEQLSKAVDGCEKFLDKIKIPDEYKSAYSSEATWETSCSENPEACAVVLVGIAPMLYTGLRFLQCGPEFRTKMTTSEVIKASKSISYQMLVTLYDLAGFWAFY
ncbi:hypothetical protein BBBOND_0110940 [Babesia bigemina]|uniref:Uncharacterized protein n=1 Tax=Babesia bigemina TaxID=5866 RepID=A0A061D228_BABBI|nr:hypothetical protein BBBOND_0110940 [Babesia bigemina]CDR94796.1 hypothetical protein BBBOND_0110940 [Babesia bigemina]|eukprot:XP_012766982.1 hypothetical protein BBBOND_0110940 [Babesia bigemina]